MADNKNDKPRTHTAWAIQQQRVRRLAITRTLEIGEGRIEGDRAYIFLDREPRGGFSGYVQLLPKGEKPAAATAPAPPDEAEGAAEEI